LRIFTHRTLLQYATKHRDAAEPLEFWYRITKRATWDHLPAVRGVFPHADAAGKYTVFNIKGNKYRLITEINFAKGFVFVRAFLTHAEYDREDWQE